jgi:NADPH-dependent 2,4-dienoyl-CoA reductase/sulfur reductase-like enzyme
MRYVIVGNGVAGVTAAIKLRSRDERAEISIVSGESDYFFSRTALMYSFMDQMSRKDLEPFERRHYRELHLDLVRGWVKNLDANSQTLTLADGRSISYDRLLLATGSTARTPNWPGLADLKDGVANFVTLPDLDACERLVPTTRQAVVVGGGLIGVELVECLLHHRIPTTFVVKDPWYWPAALAAAEGAMVNRHIERHGARLVLNRQIAEVQSDAAGRVGAVILDNQDRLPCQFLGICIGVEPQVRWLLRVVSPPAINRGILTDTQFRTNLLNVFAAGDCAEVQFSSGPRVEQIWYSAKRQGELAALSMLGDAIDYQPPLFFNSAKFFGIEYTTVGQLTGGRQFYWRHPKREISVRLVTDQQHLTGANFLGSRWNHTVVERWIHERRTIEYVVQNLRQAQFDTEFDAIPIGEFQEVTV